MAMQIVDTAAQHPESVGASESLSMAHHDTRVAKNPVDTTQPVLAWLTMCCVHCCLLALGVLIGTIGWATDAFAASVPSADVPQEPRASACHDGLGTANACDQTCDAQAVQGSRARSEVIAGPQRWERRADTRLFEGGASGGCGMGIGECGIGSAQCLLPMGFDDKSPFVPAVQVGVGLGSVTVRGTFQ